MKYTDIPYDVLETSIKKLFEIKFNPEYSLKKMGLDELDEIELLLEIEKELDDMIPDEEWEKISNSKNFYFLKKYTRDVKLKKLGI